MCFKRVLLFLLVETFWVNIDGSFQLFGSKTVKYGENYEVFIAKSYQESDGKKLELQLDGKSSGVISRKMIELNSKDEIVSFDLKKRKIVENFTLSAKIANSSYSQNFDIEMIHGKFSVLIQTDKAFYTPGEKMRFRAFIADSKMQPYHSDKLVFEVKDASGKAFYKQEEVEGQDFKEIYDQVVSIDKSSQAGTWTIEISELDDDEEVHILGFKEFLVSNQLSPRFDVTINSKHATLKSENSLELEIFAKFDFGFYVKGKVTIQPTVTVNGKKWKGETKAAEIAEKKVIIFNISENLKLSDVKEKSYVTFECEFEEAATGSKVVKYHQVTICQTLCNDIEIVKVDKRLIPGLSYAFEVKAYSMGERNLIQAHPKPVNVKIVSHINNLECSKLEGLSFELEGILTNGVAKFSFETLKNASSISIIASFLSSTEAIHVAAEKTSEYLRIEMVTEKPTVKENIDLKFLSTTELDVLHCVIFQSSNIVHNSTIDAMYYNEVEYSFETTSDMFPSINVFIYYATETGEIVSDELFIEINDDIEDFSEELQLHVTPDTLNPNSNCLFTVTSSPGATVSLTVVDAEDFERQKNMKSVSRESNSIVLSDHRSCLEVEVNEKNEQNVSAQVWQKGVNVGSQWLFDIVELDDDGVFILNKTVPDSITKWTIAAISLDPLFGFKFSDVLTVSVEQTFFAKVDMPGRSRFGEIVPINVVVFNQLKSTKVTVTLQRSEESEDFEFIEKTQGCKFDSHDNVERSKHLTVSSNSSESITFLIRPLKLGNINLAVKVSEATANNLFQVEKVLTVELEGLAKYLKHSYPIDLLKTNQWSKKFSFYVPQKAVESSIAVEGMVIGSLLGETSFDISTLTVDTITSTEKTVLLNHMKSLFMIKYQTTSKKLSTIEQTLASNQLTSAVNQIMNRKKSDGSFNFRGQGLLESLWLTAYTVKSLSQVKNLSSVDEASIENALNFLKNQQQSSTAVDTNNKSLSGSFVEFGIEKRVNISLTAFVAISFLEGSRSIADHGDCVNRALDFIDRNILQMKNNLEISMSAYAFALAGHKSSKDLQDHLESQAIVERGTQHWRFGLEIETDEGNSAENGMQELEIAAYAVLARIASNEESKVYPIMMWMVEQLNLNEGSFKNKNSFVTVQAFTELVRIYFSSTTNMNLLVSSAGEQADINIDKSKARYFQLPNESREIMAQASGTGFGILEMTLKYAELLPKFKQKFTISINVKPREDDDDYLGLVVCLMNKEDGVDNEEESKDHTLVDVAVQFELPQGFIYDPDAVSKKMLNILNLKKIEILIRQSLVTLYFDFKANTKICPEIRARRVAKVQQSSLSTVKVQYRQETVAVEYYSVKGSQYCGI